MESEARALRVGAGKEALEGLEGLLPLEGFGCMDGELHARALLLEADMRIALISLELTDVRDYEVRRLKRLVAEKTGASDRCIWICVTHTFSAPHIRSEAAVRASDEVARANGAYCSMIERAVAGAVDAALAALQPASIGFGQGYSKVNVNRDVRTDAGWWLGADELGPSDGSIPLVRFDGRDGEPVAALFSYDIQSSVMHASRGPDGLQTVCGDVAGRACSHIEAQYGDGFVAWFAVGAAGDQAPLFQARHTVLDRYGHREVHDIGADGRVLLNALGKRLGDQAVRALERIPAVEGPCPLGCATRELRLPGQRPPDRLDDLRPTRVYDFASDEDRATSVSLMRWGPVAIVGIGPSINSITAMSIRAHSPFPLTVLLTMVNGGEKYLPDESAYDRVTYEAMNSRFARGGAEALSRACINMLVNTGIGKELP